MGANEYRSRLGLTPLSGIYTIDLSWEWEFRNFKQNPVHRGCDGAERGSWKAVTFQKASGPLLEQVGDSDISGGSVVIR